MSGNRSAPDASDLERWFKHHPPRDDQIEDYQRVRAAGREMAFVLLDLLPDGPDKTTAIRKIREAVWTANAAIACDPDNQ